MSLCAVVKVQVALSSVHIQTDIPFAQASGYSNPENDTDNVSNALNRFNDAMRLLRIALRLSSVELLVPPDLHPVAF